MKMLLVLPTLLFASCVSPKVRGENESMKVQLAEIGGMLKLLPRTHQLELQLAYREGFMAGQQSVTHIVGGDKPE